MWDQMIDSLIQEDAPVTRRDYLRENGHFLTKGRQTRARLMSSAMRDPSNDMSGFVAKFMSTSTRPTVIRMR